jgi:LPXTG-motif cell wall-anchored protein
VKLKSSLLRTSAVLGSAIIGLVGVAAAAAPASAHNASVSGVASCRDGKNIVTWQLTNDWPGDATISDLNLPKGEAPKAVEPNIAPLADGSVITKSAGYSPKDATMVHYTQVVDDAPSVTLSFTATWADGTVDSKTGPKTKSADNTATVQLKRGCTPSTPKPRCVDAKHATFNHTFDVNQVGGTTIINLDDNVTLCRGVEVPITSVSYYAPQPKFDVPQYLFDKDSGKLTNDHRSLKLWVRTPPCYTQVDTFFGTEQDIIPTITKGGKLYGVAKLGTSLEEVKKAHYPYYSKGVPAWYNGGDRSCVTPASTSVTNCDGTQVINLSNDGKYEETFTVKYGDQTKTVTVGAGKGESVNVPADAGTVTVSAEGMEDQTYNWTAPQDCALPAVTIANTCKDVTITVTNPEGVTPAKATVAYGKESKELTVAAGSSEKATFAAGSATVATIKIAGIDKEITAALKKLTCTTPVANNGGGTLPITGAAGGSIAAGAALLLIAGGVFFFVARRRKVRFTA